MKQLTKPDAISRPFASGSGALKNVIPNNATGTYNASMEEGFPAITMQPLALGGTPPDGKDMNGILNKVSQFYFQFQNGYLPTFDQATSDLIGGYPQGAVLWHTTEDSVEAVISLIEDNTYNFVTTPSYIDGIKWKKITYTYRPNIFTWQWADHELDDVQWLRADTFSWQSGAVYQAAYQHLADDIDGKTLQSETIGSTTIQFYLADDGHKICPANQESIVNYIYGTSGVAWYYIIDTVNQRFKLPRTQFGVTGYRGTVGGYIEAGLPNITGTFNQPAYENIVATGAFGTTSNSSRCANGGDDRPVGTFDASRCSSVYGRASTVQPKATQMYLYFYVGNFTQTALENTAGINASLFNGKADVSALNAATAHVVIETQEPTSANNYTWYRLYADGWVEQGGRVQSTSVDYEEQTVTFPVEMADIGYMVTITPESSYGSTMEARGFCFFNPTTTSMKVAPQVNTITWGNYWQVSGKAA